MPGASTTRNASSLPLRSGDHGEAVVDIQHRLAKISLANDDLPGEYGRSTADAIRAFQQQRGLPSDGVCDSHTWSSLVEAGYGLGDRLLYRHTPMLRGDDVAELQRRLSALGFDSGTIDGIFGDHTVVALMDFQRNAGLLIDGICGRRTIDDLLRLQSREGGSDLVSPVHERLRLATNGSASLEGRRIGVGERGGFGAGVVAICRTLRDAGATAHPFHHPDASRQAIAANATGIECFVSLVIRPDFDGCLTAFYRGFHYESLASRRLAELVQDSLPSALSLTDRGIAGMSLPVLRETRMPAIEVQLGSPALVVQHTVELAQTIVEALAKWLASSVD